VAWLRDPGVPDRVPDRALGDGDMCQRVGRWVSGSRCSTVDGKTYCHLKAWAAFGYFLARAWVGGAKPRPRSRAAACSAARVSR